jgi:hypothetical protein
MISLLELLAYNRVVLIRNNGVLYVVKAIVDAQKLISLLQHLLRDCFIVLLVVLDDLDYLGMVLLLNQ